MKEGAEAAEKAVLAGTRSVDEIAQETSDAVGHQTAGGINQEAVKGVQSTALVTKYPANAEIAGTAERTFLMPGQVIDRYGALGGKWFSTPGSSYGTL